MAEPKFAPEEVEIRIALVEMSKRMIEKDGDPRVPAAMAELERQRLELVAMRPAQPEPVVVALEPLRVAAAT